MKLYTVAVFTLRIHMKECNTMQSKIFHCPVF